VKAAKCFDAEVITIPKSQAGANAKAPYHISGRID
jgi:hypothetical protein